MTNILRILALAGLVMALPMQAQANKLLMPGEVIKGHAKEEEACEKCHKKFDKGAQSRLCMDCHKEVGKDVREKTGYHGRMEQGKECKECHAEHKGREAKVAEFDHDKFDHALTDYPLRGKHTDPKVKCEDCHKAGKKFSEAPTICNDCHKKDDKHKGSFGAKCESCHVEKDWKEILFDHDKKTKYPLLGKHKEVKCATCHTGDLFKDKLQMTCVSCHKKDDDKAHKAKFGAKCESCHVERGWKEILFDHDKKTKYKLLGKHKDAKCSSCHKGDLYKDKIKVTTCVSCHKKEDDKAHKGNFGAKCESCHVERDWKEIMFDHDKETKYKLLGKHRDAKCTTCHKGDLYKDKIKVTTCVSCHKKEDDKAHKANFGAKCESCHVERGWKEILFDHDKETKYKLLGKHKEAKCTTCHKGDLYKEKLKTDCFSCHEKDDKHKGQEGKKCETCHGEQLWIRTTFNHAKMSKFPLLGRHALVDCKKCHAAPTFKDAKEDCWSCHEREDVHKRKFGTECQDCHNARDWKAWDFNHGKTDFKLDGPHRKPGCYQCHQRPMGAKVVLSKACGSCHDRDDIHNGGYGDQCQRCHDGDKWNKVKTSIRR